MNKQSNPFCTNCGNYGHSTKQCIEPITSFGIILFRIRDGGAGATVWNQATELSHSSTLTTLEPVFSNIEFLLIQRKDTLGFIELMRGKYSIDNISYIKKHIGMMTRREQGLLLTSTFEELWEILWGKPTDSHSYRNEREIAREKFEQIRRSGLLAELIREQPSEYEEAEWGFPKGRRDLFESDFSCAVREMFEETGIRDNDIYILHNLEPLTENFIGTNHLHYRHRYYVAYMPSIQTTKNPLENEHMRREIRSLHWFTLEEAIAKIRPYHVEKKEMLVNVSSLLHNFCPLILPKGNAPHTVDGRRGSHKRMGDSRGGGATQ